MQATIAHEQPRRRNLDGGRPTDPLTAAFDGLLEGLVACRDDRKALVTAIDHLRDIRAIENRLVDHIQLRVRRLAGGIEPELERIVADTDRALSHRTHVRRASRV